MVCRPVSVLGSRRGCELLAAAVSRVGVSFVSFVLLFLSFLGLVFWLGSAGLAWGQSIQLDFGEGGSVTARLVQLIVFLTVISLAPSLLVMVTSFTRIVVVMSILRTALGTQTTPPNAVLVSLALFMTFFVMQPALEQAWEQGVRPLIDEQITEAEAYELSVAPVREFMLRNVRPRDLQLFFDMGAIEQPEGPEATPLRALVPAFMISELRRAFEIGFLIFLPFLVIDMVIAAILLSMGMMMLPPVIISLPFKLIFFVLVDGWYLLVGSLIQSFA